MMTKRTKRHAPRPRLTIPLTGTIATVGLKVDTAAVLAIEYGRHWAHLTHRQRPPASGIVRRALQVYMGHLAELPEGAPRESECRAVVSACKPGPADQEAHDAALNRLEAAAATGSLPPYRQLLHPGAAAFVAALDARVEELLGHMRRRRIKNTKDINT